MGWKNVKTHYRIEHTVRVQDGCIVIGNGYEPESLKVDAQGTLVGRYSGRTASLLRYQAEMDDDPQQLQALVQAPDQFEAAIAVYTWVDGEIVERKCEEIGWPNITHDGDLMYNNVYSTDPAEVVEWARANAIARVDSYRTHLAEAEARLAEWRQRLAEAEIALQTLETTYPQA